MMDRAVATRLDWQTLVLYSTTSEGANSLWESKVTIGATVLLEALNMRGSVLSNLATGMALLQAND